MTGSDPTPGTAAVSPRPWRERSLALCGLAGLLAALAVPRGWAHATLSDRGADLLVVTRTGWDLRPNGPLVVALGLLAVVLCVLARWSGRTALALPLVAAGLAVAGLALGELHAADPDVHRIGRLRIGTFQTDEPVAVGTVGAWLWVTVLAGAVMAAAAATWLVLSRRPAAGPGGGRSGADHGL
ncbi:conserved membrane hypothetical protein [Frankia canadensis]|uniref:Tryptophan-associated transmembrane protein n=1 Tax=Frankia canadensis TaxID=1836972 RepID=A0A2I2KRC5_9ACTN|nr:hypothetical protein [Frankia canadensis]SNQ48221.1 conserved membrane hypothetical protein [Frankia canadensis]SOU55511.1 conserved membrane hypothetical protein [Frankia canadensis]